LRRSGSCRTRCRAASHSTASRTTSESRSGRSPQPQLQPGTATANRNRKPQPKTATRQPRDPPTPRPPPVATIYDRAVRGGVGTVTVTAAVTDRAVLCLAGALHHLARLRLHRRRGSVGSHDLAGERPRHVGHAPFRPLRVAVVYLLPGKHPRVSRRSPSTRGVCACACACACPHTTTPPPPPHPPRSARRSSGSERTRR
jgi:hypothetical protein